MRRRLSLLCAAALAVTGAATLTPAAAAPGPPPSAGTSDPAAVPGELIVGYVAGADDQARGRARGRAEARLAERVVAGRAGRAEVERVHLPQGKNREQAIAELRSDPAVAYAEPNWIHTHSAKPGGGGGGSTDYFTSGSLWGMYGNASSPANGFGSQAAEAWTTNTGSKGVYVGVIDEGIQVTHPDLDANVWTNPFDPVDGRDNDGNGYVDDTNGWDFAGNDGSVYDGGHRGSADDHGTHVAGTIGAESNATGVVGINHAVTMISGKFLGSRGGTTANAIKAVDYFTDLKTRHGLDIVATNNSWGGGGFSQGLYDAIERAGAASILFVAAAGNGGGDQVGDDNDVTAHYPSSYANSNIIAVAAITSTGARSAFSNWGRTSVDVGAPGSGIWSTTAKDGYSSYNGTSMATPHVTGAAALYAASHPDATAAEIKAAILGSALPTTSLTSLVVTGGRLDASGF